MREAVIFLQLIFLDLHIVNAAGSFGTAEQFGSNLVGGMDQSFLKKAPKWATGRGNQPLQVDTLSKISLTPWSKIS